MSYIKAIKQKMTCGSCRYLTRDRFYETPCATTGRVASSRSCAQHSPDVFTLVKGIHRVGQIKDLSVMLQGFSANDITILAAILLRTKHLKRFGHSFFQKVYLRVAFGSQESYLNQFAIGYIVDADKHFVRVISESGECSYSLMYEKESRSYYTVARFKLMRQDMLESKRFVDPASTTPYVKTAIRGEIPTLDQVDAIGGVDTKQKGSRKIKRLEKDDLTAIISKMQRGIMRADKKAHLRVISDDSHTIVW